MFKKISSNSVFLILSIGGILISIFLIISDIRSPGYCPKIASIPACYIVLGTFYLVLRSCLTKTRWVKDLLFFSGAAIGLLLAIWFSYNQITGLKECPKVLNFPLCYASFLTFSTLLLIRFYELIKKE